MNAVTMTMRNHIPSIHYSAAIVARSGSALSIPEPAVVGSVVLYVVAELPAWTMVAVDRETVAAIPDSNGQL